MTQLHFDCRDLFRSVRLGWSLKRMWVAFCGILAHYIVYAGCAYAGLAWSGGASVRGLWLRHGFFPEPTPTLAYAVGAVLALYILLLTSCAISRITCQHLRGDAFFTSGDAWKFLRSSWTGIIVGPAAVLGLLAMFLFCGWVIGAIGGLIPIVGTIGVAGAFLPIFLAALAALFIAVAGLVALLFGPAIVGATGEDGLEVMIQSFSLLWSQPWRLLLYYAGVLGSVAVGVGVLGCLTFYAICLINCVMGLAMGAKLAGMMVVALQYVPDRLLAFFFTGGILQYPDLLARLPEVGWPGGSTLWAGRLLALSLLGVVGIVLSFALSAHSSGVTLIYLILRKKKDGENLLERGAEKEEKLAEAATAAKPPGAADAPAESEAKP